MITIASRNFLFGRRRSDNETPAPPIFRRPPWVYHQYAGIIRRIAWRAQNAQHALPLVERELKSTVVVPWKERPRLWRQGFLSESSVLYDLTDAKRPYYLTDAERSIGVRTINGRYGVVLDDKLLFDQALTRFADVKPELYGILNKGAVTDSFIGGSSSASLVDTVRRHRDVVIKPASGGGGEGYYQLHAVDDGTFELNLAPCGADRVHQLATECENFMVTGFVSQHPDIAALYPRSTNTARILTMLDDDGTPFVAAAVLRIGRQRSAPTDNWIKGGMSAAIDLHHGSLGHAASYPAGERSLEWYRYHPETEARIAGAHVPHWQTIRSRLCEIAGAFPYLPQVGWDIAFTPDGFSIIEGNSYSNVNLFQIHRPLLEDERVRDFYVRNKVFSGRRRRIVESLA